MTKQLALLLFFITFIVMAQDSTEISAQDAIENIINDASDEQDLLRFVEELEYLQQHPINLTAPNYNDLLRLPFVSPLLAEAIVLYTDTVEIISPEQLLNVSLMTPALYEKLLPFVTVEQASSSARPFLSLISPSKLESRTRYERRLQTAKGFTDNSFRGDVNNAYQRMKIGNGNVEAGALFEKDAGELYSDGLIAGYISVKEFSILKRCVIGNYNITSGQGLVLARNISPSKGSDVIGQVKKRSSSISPSISTDEFRYFQGTAANIQFSDFSFVGFYSQRMLPASIDNEGFATSFYTSGTYRTDNDLKKREALSEKVTGGKIDYFIEKSKSITFTAMRTEYNKFLKPALLDLQGRKNITAGSISWDWLFSSFNFYGETASNDGVSYSKVIGVTVPVAKEFAVSYHHRAFSKGFVSPFARPFGEREYISDGELGNYFGCELRFKKVAINSYVDDFALPAIEPGFDVTGREIFSQFIYSGIKNIELLFQIRNKAKSQIEVRELDDKRRQTNYRAAYKFRISRSFSLAQRFEAVNVSYAPTSYKEKGFLTFVEGIFKEQKVRLSTKLRMVFFDTNSYDSRLYQYESDVAGNFLNPPLYGKGIRWYVVAGYEVFDGFQFSFKYSETKKLHVVVLGSGDDEIIGNLDNYIALQLDFKL